MCSNEDKEIHNELEDRIQRFGQTNPLGDYKINRFNTIQVLSDLEQVIKKSKVHVCRRNYVCNCKGECICDDDDFIDVGKTSFDTLSNCRFMITMDVTQNLRLNRKKDVVRIFALDELQNETVLFDIILPEQKLRVPCSDKVITFDLDEIPSFKFNTITISLSYINYSDE